MLVYHRVLVWKVIRKQENTSTMTLQTSTVVWELLRWLLDSCPRECNLGKQVLRASSTMTKMWWHTAVFPGPWIEDEFVWRVEWGAGGVFWKDSLFRCKNHIIGRYGGNVDGVYFGSNTPHPACQWQIKGLGSDSPTWKCNVILVVTGI